MVEYILEYQERGYEDWRHLALTDDIQQAKEWLEWNNKNAEKIKSGTSFRVRRKNAGSKKA